MSSLYTTYLSVCYTRLWLHYFVCVHGLNLFNVNRLATLLIHLFQFYHHVRYTLLLAFIWLPKFLIEYIYKFVITCTYYFASLLGFKVFYSNCVALIVLYNLQISMLVLFKWPIHAFKIRLCLWLYAKLLKDQYISSDSVPKTY